MIGDSITGGFWVKKSFFSVLFILAAMQGAMSELRKDSAFLHREVLKEQLDK